MSSCFNLPPHPHTRVKINVHSIDTSFLPCKVVLKASYGSRSEVIEGSTRPVPDVIMGGQGEVMCGISKRVTGVFGHSNAQSRAGLL
jgi:hypothetical protein